MILDFIEDQILGMRWLDSLAGSALSAAGIDPAARIGGSLRFLMFDFVKISILLVVLVFAISYVQSYFPPERSRRLLGRFKGLRANAAAALLGTVTPFCSCSSIPIFIGFTRAGLPAGVTFSFLISSPMVDLGSLVLLMGIFGTRIALLYVAAGLVVAMAGGALIEMLHMEDQIEPFAREGAAQPSEGHAPSFMERLSYASGQAGWTYRRVLPYLAAGVAIGSLIHNWIPSGAVETALGGDNPLGVVIAVIAGIPMYADIFGTVPIAEALLGKGALLGVVLSFMMAVTTLSLPSLIMLRKAVRPKLLWLFIAICTGGIIMTGYLFNLIEPLLG